MSEARDALLDALLVERYGPLTRLLAERSHDQYAERRRVLDAEAAEEVEP